ncbi:hypothetical protein GGE07_006011 [Sinorhizobium terangae]|nr:hypothetical protein [Sinorhizobium terangae]MBB4189329.1 hypothetical protein [Sinorhizobium terangae]
MRAETYAVVNLAALNLIEAMSAAYYATEAEAAARHAFRVREMLKKIATALEREPAYGTVEALHVVPTLGDATGNAPKPAGIAPPQATKPASPRLTLVSGRSAAPASPAER